MECVACYDFKARVADELGFKQKDIIKVISDPKKVGEQDWMPGELNGKTGMVPKNYIVTPEWFYRGLSRAQAERLLMGDQPDGAFLIRESESSPGDFSLSVKFGQGVQHFKILVDATGKYFLWKRKFDSVNKLVNHFRHTSVSQPELPDEIFLKDMVKKKTTSEAQSPFGAGIRSQQIQQKQQNLNKAISANGLANRQQEPKSNAWGNRSNGKAVALKPPTEQRHRVKALYDFEPQDETELELRAGDIVEVLDCSDQNWWHGKLRTKKGLFPKTYIQELK